MVVISADFKDTPKHHSSAEDDDAVVVEMSELDLPQEEGSITSNGGGGTSMCLCRPAADPGAFRVAPGQEMTRIPNTISLDLVGASGDAPATTDSASFESQTTNGASDRRDDEDGGLVVARQVSDENSAIPIPASKASSHRKTPVACSSWTLLVAAGMVLLVGAIGLALLVRPQQGLNNGGLPSPSTDAATLTTTVEDHLWNLLPDYTTAAMARDASTPQAQAYQWMLQDPQDDMFTKYSDDRILQRFALATLYYSTTHGHSGWDNHTHWLDYDVHECDWAMKVPEAIWYSQDLHDDVAGAHGPCHGTDHYQHLWLFHNRLVGTVPPELGLLTGLINIDLSKNQLSGSLPTQVGQLVRLERLYLFRNSMSGVLPTHIGLLGALQELRVETNVFSGALPTQLGHLSHLEWMWGFDNLFSDRLPTELGALDGARMRRLELFGNALSGFVPSEMGSLTSLGELTLDHNALTGPIPSELGMLQVGLLFLHANQLTGTIPTDLGRLKEAYRLYLFSNQVTGSIPSEIGTLRNIEILLLHNNLLTGELPDSLGNLQELFALYLNLNEPTGVTPPEWKDALELRDDLDWDQNRFSGSLPSTLGKLTKLQYLWLPHNHLTSTLPSELGLLTQLAALSVAQNPMLSGTIPQAMAAIATNNETSLIAFDVSGTNLQGTIPAGLCSSEFTSFALAFDCTADLCGCDCECT